MVNFILGAAKALVAGVATGGYALLLLLGVDETLATVLWVIGTPLLTYLVPNVQTKGPQESAVTVRVPGA